MYVDPFVINTGLQWNHPEEQDAQGITAVVPQVEKTTYAYEGDTTPPVTWKRMGVCMSRFEKNASHSNLTRALSVAMLCTTAQNKSSSIFPRLSSELSSYTRGTITSAPGRFIHLTD